MLDDDGRSFSMNLINQVNRVLTRLGDRDYQRLIKQQNWTLIDKTPARLTQGTARQTSLEDDGSK